VEHPGRPLPQSSDRLVGRCISFVKRLKQQASKGQTAVVAHADPALHAAYELYTRGEPIKRTILEAWLLTGAPNAQIAAKTGASVEVIEAYEAFFYNIADLLMHPDAIACCALKFFLHPAATLDNVLKRYAYIGGPAVLEKLIEFYTRPAPLPGDPRASAAYAKPDDLLIKIAVAIFLLPPTPENADASNKVIRWLRGHRVRVPRRVFAKNLPPPFCIQPTDWDLPLVRPLPFTHP
jgi:hypothetical protein